jgi:hypothetical protein
LIKGIGLFILFCVVIGVTGKLVKAGAPGEALGRVTIMPGRLGIGTGNGGTCNS